MPRMGWIRRHWPKAAGLAALALSAIRVAGDIDFIIQRYRDPSWIGAVISALVDLLSWIFITLALTGFALIAWDVFFRQSLRLIPAAHTKNDTPSLNVGPALIPSAIGNKYVYYIVVTNEPGRPSASDVEVHLRWIHQYVPREGTDVIERNLIEVNSRKMSVGINAGGQRKFQLYQVDRNSFGSGDFEVIFGPFSGNGETLTCFGGVFRIRVIVSGDGL